MLLIALAIAIAAAGLVIALLWHSGAFEPVVIRVSESAPAPFGSATRAAFKCQRGPCKASARLFAELGALVPAGSQLFGVYYDDPQVTPADQCRHAVAVVTEVDGVPQLDSNYMRQLDNWGYTVSAELAPIGRAVVTSHVWRSNVAIVIAAYRVYSRIAAFVNEHRLTAVGPCVEIYRPERCTIDYCVPLDSWADAFKEHV